MAESNFLDGVDLSPFIRTSYTQKSINELLHDADNNRYSAYELARRYQAQNDLRSACKYYEIAAKLGDTGAPMELGLIYHRQHRYKKAAPFFETAVKLTNNIDAQVYLAQYYILGKIGGIFSGKKEGFRLLLNASKLGYGKAQYLLALAYMDGAGTPKNIREYVFWMRCAQRNRYPAAIEHLRIRTSDPQYARAWSELLAEADHKLAQHTEYLRLEQLANEIRKNNT